MLRVAVCDDEHAACDYLSGLVVKFAPYCEVDCYLSGEELLKAPRVYDIALLDIQMKSLDGIEAAGKLREAGTGTVIIFVTGLRQHVFRAFDVGAFHYLLKPIDEEKFRQVFLRATAQCQARQSKHSLIINSRNLHRTLIIEEIQYVESARRKVVIHTREEQIETYATMEELGVKLGSAFFRCHRGYFVNMAEISGYDGSTIRLKSGAILLLSKQKYNGAVG